jgi:hypothetical protein
VDAAEYSLNHRSELADRVHAAIAAALPPDQQPFLSGESSSCR